MCPSDPLSFNELGVVYFRQGHFAKAAEHFGKVLELTGHLPPAKREAWESCYFNLGHARRKLRDFDGAIDAYEAALALRPNDASTYAALGFAWHLKGGFEQAIEYVRPRSP